MLVVPTACGGNDRDVVDSDAVGLGLRAVPLKETTRLAPFEPFTVKMPVSAPGEDVSAGAKLTL